MAVVDDDVDAVDVDLVEAPGRLNLLQVHGVDVIVDYCHNAAGMKMLGDFVDRFAEPSPGDLERHRRIGVIATAGDRRDEDMRELGEVSAKHFDSIIVREDVNRRQREKGETAALVVEGVRAAMETGEVRCRDVEVIQDEIEAACIAVSRANPGDLVVVCVDQTTRVWAELQAIASSPRGSVVEPPSPDVQLSLGDPDLTGFTSNP